MRTLRRIIVFSALAVLSATNCQRDFSTSPDRVSARPFTPLEKRLLESGNTFGFKLLGEVSRLEDGKNIFLSPLSVSMALGMTLNGAAGETETAMRRALGFGDMTREDVNAAYRGILDLLPVLDLKTRIEIANSIWIRLGFSVLPAFTDVNQRIFDAAVQGLDFNSPEAPAVINGWIEDRTRGRITKMIDQIDPLTVMFLINAVYFKGAWLYEFDPKMTLDDSFVKSDGSLAPCRMMEQKTTLPYFETETFQAVELPYGNGQFSMTVFLPKPGLPVEALAVALSPETWSSWKGRFSSRELTLQFPKFKVEYEIRLNDALTSLGMGVAFDPARADFDGINADFDLYISSVNHKAFVEVDEEGTEAAAVTVVEVGYTSVGGGITVRVDRPFLFLIREKSSDAILFMGKIEVI
jgi:serine protease inhibitor